MDESMQLTSFYSSDLTLPHLLPTCRVESTPLIFGGLPPVEMRGNCDGCSMYFKRL